MGMHSAPQGIERMDAGGLCGWDSLNCGLVSIGCCSPGGRVVLSWGGLWDCESLEMVGTGWQSTLQWLGLPSSGQKLPPEDLFPVSGFLAFCLAV